MRRFSCATGSVYVWRGRRVSERSAEFTPLPRGALLVRLQYSSRTRKTRTVKRPEGRAPVSGLFVEPEVHQVIVLHNVRFCFQAQFAGSCGLRFATGLDDIVKADDLSADEPFLNVGVDDTAGFPRRGAVADRPGAVFLSSHGQETDVAA